MTDYLLFIDTEASGLPKDWKKPYSEKDNWPFCVQVAWIIFSKNGQFVKQEDFYIKENDFKTSKSALKIHGITDAFRQANGQSRKKVLEILLHDIITYQPLVVGHFMQFDYKVLGADAYRSGIENPVKAECIFCTMLATTKMVKNPALHYFRLGQLYQNLFLVKLQNEHNAIADAKATAVCFFELVERGAITDEIIALQKAKRTKIAFAEKQKGCSVFLLFIVFFTFLIFYLYD